MKKLFSAFVIGLSAAAFAVACSDTRQPLAAPDRSGAAASHLLGDVLGDSDSDSDSGDAIEYVVNLLVQPVRRPAPLPHDVTWSFEAGPDGASSSSPAVGLAIVVPQGALATSQLITVTALAGAPIAYKFEPHGLVFQRSVVLTQTLRGTAEEAALLPLIYGAYFATDRLELSLDGLASVTEIVNAVVSPLNRTVAFPIAHFSGYIVASGRTDPGGETGTP